ncbi:MAG: hypothetical protein CFE42_08775 [Ralstonia sp. PBBBR1]|nr:MAG: hypothetical protein CFE42_08775 [Ralstonia sp. PBBBR1]
MPLASVAEVRFERSAASDDDKGAKAFHMKFNDRQDDRWYPNAWSVLMAGDVARLKSWLKTHVGIEVKVYTKTVRPPQQFKRDLKVRQIRLYGYADKRLRDYEEDHLVALEIGGSPDSAKNLWPQPRHVIGNWGSLAKEKLENRLHTLVCHRKIPLAQAQWETAHDWIAAYKRYVGSKGPVSR